MAAVVEVSRRFLVSEWYQPIILKVRSMSAACGTTSHKNTPKEPSCGAPALITAAHQSRNEKPRPPTGIALKGEELTQCAFS